MVPKWRAFTVVLALLAAGPVAAADILSGLLWQARPLVVAAVSADDPMIARLKAGIESSQAGFVERRMVLIEVYPEHAWINGRRLPTRDADHLRVRFGIGAGEPRWVLIGLDGGVKLEGPAGDSPDEVYALIDGMPMRRRELEARGSPGLR